SDLRLIALSQPLNKFPICSRELFLLVGRAAGQFNYFLESLRLLASARTQQVEPNGQLMPPRLVGVSLRLADDAQSGARRIQMPQFGREEPGLQMFDELFLLGGLLDLSETIEIGIAAQFQWQRAFGAQ